MNELIHIHNQRPDLRAVQAKWQRRSGCGLLALYGTDFNVLRKQATMVGNWTNKFIYRTLYERLAEELKRKRKLHAAEMGSEEVLKLHQFIEQNAKESLKTHLIKVSTRLESSTTRHDFYERFAAMFCGQQQLLLQGPDVPTFSGDGGQSFDNIKNTSRAKMPWILNTNFAAMSEKQLGESLRKSINQMDGK